MKPQFSEELISAYLDGELTADEQSLVEAALRDDATLRQWLDDCRRAREQLQRLPRVSLDADFAARVLRAAERHMLTAAADAPVVDSRNLDREDGKRGGTGAGRGAHDGRVAREPILREQVQREQTSRGPRDSHSPASPLLPFPLDTQTLAPDSTFSDPPVVEVHVASKSVAHEEGLVDSAWRETRLQGTRPPVDRLTVESAAWMRQQAAAVRRWRIAFACSSSLAVVLFVVLASQSVGVARHQLGRNGPTSTQVTESSRAPASVAASRGDTDFSPYSFAAPATDADEQLQFRKQRTDLYTDGAANGPVSLGLEKGEDAPARLDADGEGEGVMLRSGGAATFESRGREGFKGVASGAGGMGGSPPGMGGVGGMPGAGAMPGAGSVPGAAAELDKSERGRRGSDGRLKAVDRLDDIAAGASPVPGPPASDSVPALPTPAAPFTAPGAPAPAPTAPAPSDPGVAVRRGMSGLTAPADSGARGATSPAPTAASPATAPSDPSRPVTGRSMAPIPAPKESKLLLRDAPAAAREKEDFREQPEGRLSRSTPMKTEPAPGPPTPRGASQETPTQETRANRSAPRPELPLSPMELSTNGERKVGAKDQADAAAPLMKRESLKKQESPKKQESLGAEGRSRTAESFGTSGRAAMRQAGGPEDRSGARDELDRKRSGDIAAEQPALLMVRLQLSESAARGRLLARSFDNNGLVVESRFLEEQAAETQDKPDDLPALAAGDKTRADGETPLTEKAKRAKSPQPEGKPATADGQKLAEEELVEESITKAWHRVQLTNTGDVAVFFLQATPEQLEGLVEDVRRGSQAVVEKQVTLLGANSRAAAVPLYNNYATFDVETFGAEAKDALGVENNAQKPRSRFGNIRGELGERNVPLEDQKAIVGKAMNSRNSSTTYRAANTSTSSWRWLVTPSIDSAWKEQTGEEFLKRTAEMPFPLNNDQRSPAIRGFKQNERAMTYPVLLAVEVVDDPEVNAGKEESEAGSPAKPAAKPSAPKAQDPPEKTAPEKTAPEKGNSDKPTAETPVPKPPSSESREASEADNPKGA